MTLNSAHQGYEYQDLITAYFILKEILCGNFDSVFDIDKKHFPDDRFDDLTIKNPKGVQRKQIKYSNDDTSKRLVKDDFANDSRDIALYKLFESWQKSVANTEHRLCLSWGEPTDDNIKNVLIPIALQSSFEIFPTKLYKLDLDKIWEITPEKFNRWNNLKTYVKVNSINRSVFQNFCDSLIIELELPKEDELKSIIYRQIEQLGIGQYPNVGRIDDFMERFAKKINNYRSQQSTNLSIQKILNDLRVQTDFGKIEQKFEIDLSKNIFTVDRFDEFYQEITSNRKTVLVGEPGSGKSWLLTNFIEFSKVKNIKVIHHYCFTGTDDDLRLDRIKSDIFFGNLIADILENFPQLQQYKENLYASNLYELNLLLSKIDEEAVLIIDGLDHIERILSSSVSVAVDQTQIIDFIKQIQATHNISIVLGSQSIIEIDELIAHYGYVKHKISKWNELDIIALMERYKVENIEFDSVYLSTLLLQKSEGNPLYLTYLLKTIQTINSVTIDIIHTLPQYDFNLKNYYDYLSAQVDCNLVSETLSCLDFRVNRDELQEIIPRSGHLEKNLKILSPILNENFSRGGIKLYHDSFRRYMLEKLSDVDLEAIYIEIINWLKSKDFYRNQKSYRNLLAYYLKAKNYDEIKKYAVDDFLIKSIFYGYSENAIKINYQYFLLIAKITQDWTLFIYLNEFNRALYTALSTDYNSEQLENFELYFEAVGRVHGFGYANQMLYYDGHKNFDDQYIAKGFYISQQNSFTPNWNLLDEYFRSEIDFDKFKYFITYLIGTNQLDEFCERKINRLLSSQYADFLKVLIIEIYSQIGFEKILDVFNTIPKTKQDFYAYKINNILDITSCESRLMVVLEPKAELSPLSLDFTKNYINQEDLENFVDLVGQYAIYDCNALRLFEDEIASENFFFNWLKFIIRSHLIEDDINKKMLVSFQEIEKVIVQNYIFLASDIDLFKGKPRAVDFTHQGRFVLQKSIEKMFMYIKTHESWKAIIDALNTIPFNYLENIDNVANEMNISYILAHIEEIDKADSDYYSEHLRYSLKKSIIYSKLYQDDKAKEELYRASMLMIAYTSRKDITLSEIIEPLTSINNIDSTIALKYAKKLKYLNEAVQRHTDGKGTKGLIIDWYENLLKIDYILASQYLISELLENEYLWKLDDMLIHFLIDVKGIDPLILHFIHRMLPANTKEEYIKSYLDNANDLIQIDERLAKLSVMDVLSRDLNNSYETLSNKTVSKLSSLKYRFQIMKPIKSKKGNDLHKTYQSLTQPLDKYFQIFQPITGLTTEEIVNIFKKDRIKIEQIISLFYYLQENFDEVTIKECVSNIITIQYTFHEEDYDILFDFVQGLNISDNTKVYLLVQLFIYSKDGWYAMFTHKEAFAKAVSINQTYSLEYLSLFLFEIFKNSGLGIASTSNLIIAFEYANIDRDIVLNMYDRAFHFISMRLPRKKEKKWKEIKKVAVTTMYKDEIALVLLLSKLKNLDMTVQQEIIYAINYMLNYNQNLFKNPLHWFFENLQYFPQLSIGAILEVILLHIDSKIEFFMQFKSDVLKIRVLNNLYLDNILDEIIVKISRV